MPEVSPEEWGARYRGARGTYQSMTARLRALAIDLLAAADIDVIQVEARTKDIDSFTRRSSASGPSTGIRSRRSPTSSIGVEDALTWIILADQEATQEDFRTIYTADSWEGFLADVRMWQQAKQRARPA
jgi:hypothetical protein